MTQDTRKDRRVKIVSLNVRYKSATVDEFIENHAHDVSRGGIFIKTANPFPPGTLLKFEIRLASDQAVIAGVGRIVWKRDAGTTSGERPAGMGVKFIKIDEPSKAIIDRLVNTKDDAGKSFEGGDEAAQALDDDSDAVGDAEQVLVPQGMRHTVNEECGQFRRAGRAQLRQGFSRETLEQEFLVVLQVHDHPGGDGQLPLIGKDELAHHLTRGPGVDDIGGTAIRENTGIGQHLGKRGRDKEGAGNDGESLPARRHGDDARVAAGAKHIGETTDVVQAVGGEIAVIDEEDVHAAAGKGKGWDKKTDFRMMQKSVGKRDCGVTV